MSTLAGFLICCVELLQLVLLTYLADVWCRYHWGTFACTCDWKISHRVFCSWFCILKGCSCKWNVWTLVWARCICLAGQPHACSTAFAWCTEVSFLILILIFTTSPRRFLEFAFRWTTCYYGVWTWTKREFDRDFFGDVPFSWNCFLQWSVLSDTIGDADWLPYPSIWHQGLPALPTMFGPGFSPVCSWSRMGKPL